MPKFLEDRLKTQGSSEALTGKSLAHYVYGAMNNLGAMKGNQETAKGKAMERKHDAKVSRPNNLGTFLHPKRKP